MSLNFWTQDPQEKIPYQQEIFGGDTISSATWSISPTGPTIGAPVNTTITTTALISGLTLGITYTVNIHIICVSGQERDPSFRIECKNK